MAQVYDGAFRTIINDCSRFIIPFINEVFGESFTGDEEIEFHPNEHMLNRQDEPDLRRITDTSFTIAGSVRKNYHLECESSAYNGDILIRVFEYDAQIALDGHTMERDTLRVRFPNSAVLFLADSKGTPDVMHIIMETPGGSVAYDVPAARMARYSLDDIFEKKLYMLLPFYIFNLRADFVEYDTDEGKLSELVETYREIIERLDRLVEEKEITSFDKGTILELSSDVLKELTIKYGNITKGVGEVMSGALIETEVRKARDEGLNAGRQEGREQRDRENIAGMLRKGKTAQAIADFCDYPIELVKKIEDELKKKDKEEGKETVEIEIRIPQE